MKRYEAMFLFDTGAARDWAAIEQEVRRLLERMGAQLLVCVKYDERKLAYEIKRRKRGTYALAYFDAPSERIGELERDVQLSEMVLRVLVLRREISEEKLAELRAHPADVSLVPASEGRRHDDDRHTYERRHGPGMDAEPGRGREASEEFAREGEPGEEPVSEGAVADRDADAPR